MNPSIVDPLDLRMWKLTSHWSLPVVVIEIGSHSSSLAAKHLILSDEQFVESEYVTSFKSIEFNQQFIKEIMYQY
jgi:hypothetical protein